MNAWSVDAAADSAKMADASAQDRPDGSVDSLPDAGDAMDAPDAGDEDRPDLLIGGRIEAKEGEGLVVRAGGALLVALLLPIGRRARWLALLALLVGLAIPAAGRRQHQAFGALVGSLVIGLAVQGGLSWFLDQSEWFGLVGGLLLDLVGFRASLWLMAAVIAVILLSGLVSLPRQLGKAKASKSMRELFAKVRETAYREGMRALRASGASKVAAGLTTPVEVLKVTPPPFEA